MRRSGTTASTVTTNPFELAVLFGPPFDPCDCDSDIGCPCGEGPGGPARSVQVTRVPLTFRSETTTKRERAEIPSRNLRMSSLPAKLVGRWLYVAYLAQQLRPGPASLASR